MKIKRSVKCSLGFATKSKHELLNYICEEYSNVVNAYIDLFWLKSIRKNDLKKDILNKVCSWFSSRMRQQSAREAIDMCTAAMELSKQRNIPAVKPRHYGNRMALSSSVCTLKESNVEEFDSWLQFRSIGNRIKLDIPIKLHRQFHKWNDRGRLMGYFTIFKNIVQFVFEVETGEKKEITNCIGIDSGINALASLSNGEQIGMEIKSMIDRIKRCIHGSRGQKRAIMALKNYISRAAKTIAASDVSLIVVEDLKNITKNRKLKDRLSKNMRSSIGKWNVSYWLNRLEQKCEENRVSFRRVLPYYTSQTCSICGSVDRKNRNGEKFLCCKCGHIANADINAAENILNRFFTGRYGAGYKTKTMLFNAIV